MFMKQKAHFFLFPEKCHLLKEVTANIYYSLTDAFCTRGGKLFVMGQIVNVFSFVFSVAATETQP